MKNKLKKKIIICTLLIIIINTIILVIWFQFKISPLITNSDKIENIITKEELQESYNNIDELLNSLESISSKYNLKFYVKDTNNKYITSSQKEDNHIFLFTSMIKVDNNIYLLETYAVRRISTMGIIIELIIFQIVTVSILMGSTFLFTRAKIIKPVDKIIADIRNYKLGVRPEKNKLHTEFDLIQNEFVTLVDSLEEEKQNQNRIIASISHDIKTPLTSIIGYSNLIEEENLTKDEMKKYNRKINEKSIHIKNILEGFDDYLSNQNNNTLKLNNIYIKDLVNDLNNDYKIDLENANIKFNVKSKIDNELITIDVLKIKRVFSNMISNSIRYIKNNGKINIYIDKDKTNYIFKVSDNGPGVDEKIISKIFDPLFTTDKSRKISGLGLSICREFILMHKGSIKAYNNNGLTIEFTIPINLNNS